MASTLRFLTRFLRPRPDGVVVRETTYRRGDESLPATLYTPAGHVGPLPGWVLLHGLTVRGRAHVSLDRFARALSGSGAAVLVPEVPEWCRLVPAPAASQASIGAAIREAVQRPEIRPERIGLLGFSFGATQAIMVAADPGVGRLLRGVAAWGGYSDFARLCRFGMNGEHELDGHRYRVDPDPYGRWLVLGNYLTRIPGYEGHGATAAALLELARAAGRINVYAWEPALDPVKERLRQGLAGQERELFDLAAPPASSPGPDPVRGTPLANALAAAAVAADPLLDPAPFLPRVRVPIVLAHGRDDRLVPFTESIRLARAVGTPGKNDCAITALFAHSRGTRPRLGPGGWIRESVRFVRLLNRVLAVP